MINFDTCLPNEYRQLVKLESTAYKNKSGYHLKRSLKLIKRKSNVDHLDDFLCDDLIAVRLIPIIDLCEDGIYKVIVFNISRDEFGHIDDWDIKLVPHISE